MESLLNFAWLSVTIVFSIALLRCARTRPDSTQVWLLVTAAVCLMILLFPVISITDDLRAVVFTAEDGKRWIAAIHVQQLPAFIHLLAAWLLLAFAGLRRVTWAPRFESAATRPLDGILASSSSRPPPPLSLL